MRKVTLNASVYVRLQKERQMLKKIVHYPVVRSEIRTFSFDGRATQWEKRQCLCGPIFRSSDGGFAAFECLQWRLG